MAALSSDAVQKSFRGDPEHSHDACVLVRSTSNFLMSRLRLFAGAGVLLWVNSLYAQEAIHEVQWSPEHFAFPQLSEPTLIQVPAVESSGFFFPYYLYIPKDLSRSEPVRLLIE